ncbi:MAG: hypothetical protein B7Y07_04555 [Halothiobacillus sp. 24-54-40]|nr:MAG: hypothetical protein B7Y58_04555 [Halothiobacillus sp. 35-54-62]OYZ87334.1 MAG: hypothetical protein B7Y07_04555 [Halothiobacillus sp. 24-54-40]OZA80493.1 MAG: hypothetical protein B7X64_05765 [Halothiobacillus sp. 39-53-45]
MIKPPADNYANKPMQKDQTLDFRAQAAELEFLLREPLIKSFVSRVTDPKAAKRGRGRRS